jgi:hypothetical protein
MNANADNVGDATVVTRQEFESPSVPRDAARLQGASRALAAGTPSLWSGTRVPPSGIMGMRAAALGNINNSTVATTSTSSNEMHINGGIHVNAPNATDATGISNHIDRALAASMFASFANYGPN